MAQPNPQPVTGNDNTVWIYLSYILGWVFGLIGLAVVKDDNEVRYHCAQGLALSALANILCFVLAFTFVLPFIIWPAAFIYGIVLALKAAKGEHVKVPYLGDFAEKHLMNLFK